MENSIEILKKPKNRATIWSSNLPTGHSREKIVIQKDIYMSMLIAALFMTARIWKQPRYPSRGEYTIYTRLLVDHKKRVHLSQF